MGAYNWIEVTDLCPSCHNHSILKFQTKTASSYDGDNTGRFFDRIYKLGDKMFWWKPEDKKYTNWWDPNLKDTAIGNLEECCHGECLNCKQDIFGVIVFNNLIPTAVNEIGLKADWPDKYF